jgi:hypothetical protein
MRKSGDEIEADFFVKIKESGIASFIRGQLYRDGKRPLNSQEEDGIVIFKEGIDGQFQDGEVVLVIYVPDIVGKDGMFEKDIARCRLISAKVCEVIDSFTSGEYNVGLAGIPKSFKVEGDVNQHFVSSRIRFSRNSIN